MCSDFSFSYIVEICKKYLQIVAFPDCHVTVQSLQCVSGFGDPGTMSPPVGTDGVSVNFLFQWVLKKFLVLFSSSSYNSPFHLAIYFSKHSEPTAFRVSIFCIFLLMIVSDAKHVILVSFFCFLPPPGKFKDKLNIYFLLTFLKITLM